MYFTCNVHSLKMKAESIFEFGNKFANISLRNFLSSLNPQLKNITLLEWCCMLFFPRVHASSAESHNVRTEQRQHCVLALSATHHAAQFQLQIEEIGQGNALF